jgi:hypothetical protein
MRLIPPLPSKLSRGLPDRVTLLRNLVTQLIKQEQIITTPARAAAIRPIVDMVGLNYTYYIVITLIVITFILLLYCYYSFYYYTYYYYYYFIISIIIALITLLMRWVGDSPCSDGQVRSTP